MTILPRVVAKTCLFGSELSPEQQAWFIDYVDRRIRYLGIDSQHIAYILAYHWLNAYTLDPERFQQNDLTTPIPKVCLLYG